MHRSPLKRRVVFASPPYCGHRNANANRQNADGRGLERSTVLHFGEFQNATHKTHWQHNTQNAPSFKTQNAIKTLPEFQNAKRNQNAQNANKTQNAIKTLPEFQNAPPNGCRQLPFMTAMNHRSGSKRHIVLRNAIKTQIRVSKRSAKRNQNATQLKRNAVKTQRNQNANALTQNAKLSKREF